MNKYLVAFATFALVLSAHAKTLTLPNGNTVETLADGEVWVTLHLGPAFRITPDMPTAGQFRTAIVENLPESNIVGAPQSMEIQILGDCQTKTFQVWGVLPYDGKMRAGSPEAQLATGPEEVTRRVETGSPMERVFHVVCKP